jgi:hypothetical protein
LVDYLFRYKKKTVKIDVFKTVIVLDFAAFFVTNAIPCYILTKENHLPKQKSTKQFTKPVVSQYFPQKQTQDTIKKTGFFIEPEQIDFGNVVEGVLVPLVPIVPNVPNVFRTGTLGTNGTLGTGIFQ